MEEKRYTSGDVRQMFNISYETVRAWTSEFSKFLSDDTNPGKGRSRHFAFEDLQVLALISEMKAKRLTYTDIHASLVSGARADPPLPHTELANAITTEQLARMQNRLVELQTEHTAIVKQLSDQLTAKDAQIDLLKQQLDEAQSKIDRLNREIGKFEVRLEENM